MQTGRIDHTNAAQELLGLRGGPAIDVAPVVVLDDMRRGPYQAFTPFHIGGAYAGAVGQYSTISILNAGPLNSRVVLDRLLFRGGVASSLFWTLMTKANADTWGASYANSGFDRRMIENTSNQPGVPVSYGTFAVPGGVANQELVPRGDTNPFETELDVTIGSGIVALFRWNVANAAIDWSIFGRYYDPA